MMPSSLERRKGTCAAGRRESGGASGHDGNTAQQVEGHDWRGRSVHSHIEMDGTTSVEASVCTLVSVRSPANAAAAGFQRSTRNQSFFRKNIFAKALSSVSVTRWFTHSMVGWPRWLQKYISTIILDAVCVNYQNCVFTNHRTIESL